METLQNATPNLQQSNNAISQEPAAAVEAPKASIFKQVTGFKAAVKEQNNNQTPNPGNGEEGKFDFKEYQTILDSIKDPNQKVVLEKAYKSFEAGYNKKFQSLAEQRKDFEARQKDFEVKLQQASQQNFNRQWTAEEVKKLVNDPTFVQAAKMVAEEGNPQNSGFTDDEWSSLSDTEKVALKAMQEKVNSLEKQNQLEAIKRINMEEDSKLREEYQNYDPQVIDTLTADILAGKVKITRESIYKAAFHDENIQKAVEFGRQLEREELSKKNNASSFVGNRVNGAIDIKAEPGERTESVFARIARQRLSEAGNNIRK